MAKLPGKMYSGLALSCPRMKAPVFMEDPVGNTSCLARKTSSHHWSDGSRLHPSLMLVPVLSGVPLPTRTVADFVDRSFSTPLDLSQSSSKPSTIAMNWFKQQLANVAGTEEPEYGPSAVQSVTEQMQTTPYTEVTPDDLIWKAMDTTNVETQTFYFMWGAGMVCMAQVIYSNVG